MSVYVIGEIFVNGIGAEWVKQEKIEQSFEICLKIEQMYGMIKKTQFRKGGAIWYWRKGCL